MKVEVVSAENVLGGRNQVQHRLFGGVLLLHWSEDQTNMVQIPVTSVLGKQVSPRLLSGGGCCWSVEEQSVSTFPSISINYDDVGKICIPQFFFSKQQKKISVLSFKTYWTELTKKSQPKQVVQKYNQTDGRRRKKKLKGEHFRFPQLRSCLL